MKKKRSFYYNGRRSLASQFSGNTNKNQETDTYACMHAYTYIYIHIHVHTYTYIYIHRFINAIILPS